jgi:putative phage-type endonuclease
LRRTNQSTAVWREPGIGATQVAAVMGCAVERDQKPFVLWAQILQDREWKLVRKAAELAQDSPEWHRWRNDGWGGSEIGSLMGVNPYRDGSPTDAVRGKIAAREGTEVRRNENPNMRRGKAKEPEARAMYERLMGWEAKPLCVLHDEHDFVRCSLDGIRPDDDLILEIKCPGGRNHEKFLQCAAVPEPLIRQQLFAHCFDYYRYQVLYQLLITGASRCHFVSYCPGEFSGHDQFALIELFPEPFEQERVLERVAAFWGFVERRELPPPEWLEPAARPPEVLGGAVDRD